MTDKSAVSSPSTCRATTKTGRPCRAPAVKGGRYCSLHASPGRAAELGQKGGRNNRIQPSRTGDTRPPSTVAETTAILADAYAQTHAGTMHPNQLSALTYAAVALFKGFEIGTLEADLQKLKRAEEEIRQLSLAPPVDHFIQVPTDEAMDRFIDEVLGTKDDNRSTDKPDEIS